jgi:hypothetical protein
MPNGGMYAPLTGVVKSFREFSSEFSMVQQATFSGSGKTSRRLR